MGDGTKNTLLLHSDLLSAYQGMQNIFHESSALDKIFEAILRNKESIIELQIGAKCSANVLA